MFLWNIYNKIRYNLNLIKIKDYYQLIKMGNQENQVREIINVKFSCYNDEVLSNTIFDFD